MLRGEPGDWATQEKDRQGGSLDRRPGALLSLIRHDIVVSLYIGKTFNCGRVWRLEVVRGEEVGGIFGVQIVVCDKLSMRFMGRMGLMERWDRWCCAGPPASG